MNIPANWKNNPRRSAEGEPAPKKQRGAQRSRGSAAASASAQVDSEIGILETVCNVVRNTRETAPVAACFTLETILSKLPYRQIIEDVYENHEPKPHSVPLITRAYEESFMRECKDASEKPCVMGSRCECMQIDKSNRFVGTEFLLPGEASGAEAKMCVLCQRQLTQKLFFDLIYDGKNFRVPIQRYGSICNQPGEYANEVMLFCPANGPVHAMPFPAVSHQRNRYEVVSRFGVRHIRQHRVGVEDYGGGGGGDAQVRDPNIAQQRR